MTKNVVARIDLNRAADGYVGVVQFVLAARGNYARHFSGLPSWVSLCLGRGLACSSGTCSPKLVVEGAMWRGGVYIEDPAAVARTHTPMHDANVWVLGNRKRSKNCVAFPAKPTSRISTKPTT